MPQRKKPNWQYPCGVCENCVRTDSKSIKCDICKKWIHLKCADITLSRYRYLDLDENRHIPYYCPNCRPVNIGASSSLNSTLPNLTNSIQLDQSIINILFPNRKIMYIQNSIHSKRQLGRLKRKEETEVVYISKNRLNTR